MTAHDHDHQHGHGHHIDDDHWLAMLDHVELENEVFGAFVTDTAHRLIEIRGPAAPPVRRVLDIGPGPGVGTCAWARLFPEATVVALDASQAMLDRTTARAAAHGLDGRVEVRLAELPAGLDGLVDIDVIWASMVLHHIGNEVVTLAALSDVLAPGGLIAIAEFGDPQRVLPDDLDIGRPGLAERLDAAGTAWVAEMRKGLPGATTSDTYPSMLEAAGLELVDSPRVGLRVDESTSDMTRQVVFGHLQRLRSQFVSGLDADDLATIDILLDPADPRGVMHRNDVFATSSRQIFIARKPS